MEYCCAQVYLNRLLLQSELQANDSGMPTVVIANQVQYQKVSFQNEKEIFSNVKKFLGFKSVFSKRFLALLKRRNFKLNKRF